MKWQEIYEAAKDSVYDTVPENWRAVAGMVNEDMNRDLMRKIEDAILSATEADLANLEKFIKLRRDQLK